MTDAEQRATIRKECESLRKLLNSVRPVDWHAILQDVGKIEADALVATGDEFQAVRQSVHNLQGRLKHRGIITPQNWEEFFDEPE